MSTNTLQNFDRREKERKPSFPTLGANLLMGNSDADIRGKPTALWRRSSWIHMFWKWRISTTGTVFGFFLKVDLQLDQCSGWWDEYFLLMKQDELNAPDKFGNRTRQKLTEEIFGVSSRCWGCASSAVVGINPSIATHAWEFPQLLQRWVRWRRSVGVTDAQCEMNVNSANKTLSTTSVVVISKFRQTQKFNCMVVVSFHCFIANEVFGSAGGSYRENPTVSAFRDNWFCFVSHERESLPSDARALFCFAEFIGDSEPGKWCMEIRTEVEDTIPLEADLVLLSLLIYFHGIFQFGSSAASDQWGFDSGFRCSVQSAATIEWWSVSPVVTFFGNPVCPI